MRNLKNEQSNFYSSIESTKCVYVLKVQYHSKLIYSIKQTV